MKNNCKCEICDKEFYVYPSEKKRGGGIYCSRQCKDIAQSKYMKDLPKDKKPNWRGGEIDAACLHCGETIKIKKCKKISNGENVFCSKSCANSHNSRQRERIGRTIKCKVCGKDRYWNPFVFTRGQGIYCSMRCRALDNIKNQKKKDTDIEILLEEWLKENDVKYEKQKSVGGICIPDFFIEPNICLFADGDYWHNQKTRKKVDERQTNQLLDNGYVVYRLLGSEIHQGKRPSEILQCD